MQSGNQIYYVLTLFIMHFTLMDNLEFHQEIRNLIKYKQKKVLNFSNKTQSNGFISEFFFFLLIKKKISFCIFDRIHH
jgi:hypothetical protein